MSGEPIDFAVVDGHFSPIDEAKISVLDLGFLRGLGVFETLRTYDGLPHRLNAHLQRLRDSAAVLDIASPFQASELRAQMARARLEGAHDDLRVNLILTPGRLTDGVFGASQATAVVLLRGLSPPPLAWSRDGVSAITFRGERVHPEFKTTAYITGRVGLLQAQAAGAHEAFYVDADGFVTEGVTSNVLIVAGGRLLSPRQPSLPGLTRQLLLQLAREAGIETATADLDQAALAAADEVLISSSIRELLPVVQVDGQRIGDGQPGPVARRLMPLLHAACRREAAAEAADAGG